MIVLCFRLASAFLVTVMLVPQTRNTPAKQQQPQQQQQTPPAQDAAAHWDNVFRQPNAPYVKDTNVFLAYAVERVLRENPAVGQKALDLAMGEGRNALFLAEKGFLVTGLDISPVAVEHAQSAAKTKNLKLDTIVADLFEHDFGKDQYDLLSLIYFNPASKVFDRLKSCVKPGGVIVIEGQGNQHLGGGPPAWSRFAPNQLLRAFADWQILEYQDGVFPCDWNDGKPTHVVRILARKPRPGAGN